MRPLKAESMKNAEIFYAIRLEDRKGLSSFRRAWEDNRALLSSDHARRCVQALLKNDTLKEALDPLLEMPGMRTGFMISTIHRLIDAKAPEEVKAYLDHTYTTWIRIVSTEEATKKVESADVQALELRCPKFCTSDADFISHKIEQGEIFRNFSEPERQNILKKIFSVDFIITSLRTFSQDIHILEACATSMRHVVRPGRQSIRTVLVKSYEPGQTQASLNEGQDSSRSHRCDEAIQDLWTFMLQNFEDMPSPGPRKTGRSLAGPAIEESRQQTLVRSARQAQRLGFQTDEVKYLLSMGAEEKHSQVAVNPESSGERLCQSKLSDSVLSTLVVKHSVERLDRRCGRPKNTTFQADRILLTRDNLQADFTSLQIKGPEITSFFILRCQHYAFFRSTHCLSGATSLSPITRTCATGPFPVEAEVTTPLEQRIKQWRAQNEESIYTDESFFTQPTDVPDVAPVKQEEGLGTGVQISFREFRDGQFHTIEKVDAEEAETTAQRLLSDKLILSHTLDFLRTHECVQAAQASGMNSIIVLPREKWSRDETLAKAVRQLKMNIDEEGH